MREANWLEKVFKWLALVLLVFVVAWKLFNSALALGFPLGLIPYQHDVLNWLFNYYPASYIESGLWLLLGVIVLARPHLLSLRTALAAIFLALGLTLLPVTFELRWLAETRIGVASLAPSWVTLFAFAAATRWQSTESPVIWWTGWGSLVVVMLLTLTHVLPAAERLAGHYQQWVAMVSAGALAWFGWVAWSNTSPRRATLGVLFARSLLLFIYLYWQSYGVFGPQVAGGPLLYTVAPALLLIPSLWPVGAYLLAVSRPLGGTGPSPYPVS